MDLDAKPPGKQDDFGLENLIRGDRQLAQLLRTVCLHALQAVGIGARVSEQDVQQEMVIEKGKDAAFPWTPVDRLGMALGGNYEARSLGLKKPDGIRNEIRIQAVALENREMRAAALQYPLLDRLAIAGPGDRKNPNLVWKALLEPITGLERVVRRSVLHEDDLSQDDTRWQALDERGYKPLQIGRLVVGRDQNTVFH